MPASRTYTPAFRKELASRISDADASMAYGYALPLSPSGDIGLQLTTLNTAKLPINEQECWADFILSTAHRDRVGDEVVPAGCDLSTYQGTPIVFAFHQDIRMPVGRSATPDGELTVKIFADRITARCYYTQAHQDARNVFALVCEGILPAVSIGFDPLAEPIPLPYIKGNPHAGHRYPEWSMLEWSNVGVGCNPYAGLDRTGGPSWAKEQAQRFTAYPEQMREFLYTTAEKARKVYDRGTIAGERITPQVMKALSTLALLPTGNTLTSGWDKPVTKEQAQDSGINPANTFAQEQNLCPTGHILRAPGSEHGQRRWNKSWPVEFEKASRMTSTEAYGGMTRRRFGGNNASEGEPEAYDFPVADMASRPSNVIWDWVSRYLNTEVKHLWQNPTFVPGARLGSFLSGLKTVLAGYRLDDTRNLHGDGTESAPVYKTIQLSSKLSDDFLIDGLSFYTDPRGPAPDGSGNFKFVLSIQPDYGGAELCLFTSRAQHQRGAEILDKAWQWAKDHNFLKGEAFALSGEFLDKTPETWDDVFLEPENRDVLQRTLEIFNQKGSQFANRGAILTGCPGNGKTLSGRLLRNYINGTFIWLSSRDFHHSGSFRGMTLAFDMGRELAPSILFIEDCDNWLGDTTIDLIKTEMDGIARSSGVWTILTTNFPERLPAALIDRPGRFHDVLHFNLPTPDVRRAMLAKWLPAVSDAQREGAVAQSDGYSGAHVWELAAFAKTLNEHDGLTPEAALQQALAKVKAQRDLIDQIQLEGSNFAVMGAQRRRKHLLKAGPVVFSEEAIPSIIRKDVAPAKAPVKAPATAPVIAKAAPAKTAIPERKPPMTRKEMSGSSGTQGGYCIPEGEHEGARKVMEGLKVCASMHAKDIGEPNEVHYHPESGAVHHVHGENAPPESLEKMKSDLLSMTGVHHVVQQAKEGPHKEDGWWQAHPTDETAKMLAHEPAVPSGDTEPKVPSDRPTDREPTEETPMGFRNKARRIAHFFATLPKATVKDYLWRMRKKASESPALRECVRKKIPKLVNEEGMPQEQAVAVSFKMCAESLGTKDPGAKAITATDVQKRMASFVANGCTPEEAAQRAFSSLSGRRFRLASNTPSGTDKILVLQRD